MFGCHFEVFFFPPSSTFCACFLLLLPSAQCQTPPVIWQLRGDGEHDDQGFASRHGALQASCQQHGPRWGKHKLLCICLLFERRRASAVHVKGQELHKHVRLPCFRMDQSCSLVSTCFCCWKVLFQQHPHDSRYYRMSDHLFCFG